MFDFLSIGCLSITESTSQLAIKLAYNFKDDPRGPQYYFRDCLIGATAQENDILLITAITKDVHYLKTVSSPQEFIDNQKND